MNQVGDTKLFTVTPTPTSPDIYSYVWEWWDGTRDASSTHFIHKTINIGGEPGTDELHYSCTAVLRDGQSVAALGLILANNPPILVPPVTVSANDAFFPYTTEIKVKAFDLDGDALTFEWSEAGTVLGPGSTAAAGTVNGTWTGNGTTVVDVYNAFENTFSLTVSGNRTLDLLVTDARGGETTFQVELRGQPQPAAVVGAGAGAVSSADFSALTRVGPGVEVAFEVYARDPAGGAVAFSWNFAGTHGWTTTAGPATGTVTSTADGGRKSVYTKSVSGELFPTGPQKTVVAVATVAVAGGATEIKLPVTLVANTSPSGITFTAKVNGVEYALASGVPVQAGDVVEFAAVGADADADLLVYEWTFIQPSGVQPSTLKLWGAKVALNTAGWAGLTVEGSVKATDRFGASVTEFTPGIPVE